MGTDEWEQVAEIGVDTGLVWVGDPGYVMTPDTSHHFGRTWEEAAGRLTERLGDRSVARFEKDGDWGDVGVGVVSGWGDGVYPVYVRWDPSRQRIVELRVVFPPPQGME